MDVELIENLVKLLSGSTELTEMEVRHGSTRLRLRRPPPPRPLKKAPPPAVRTTSLSEDAIASPSGTIVRSELVGIFQAQRPDPVAVGQTVKDKHVLGQIEAMRLLNAVAAPHGGRVQAVLVQDGQPVEYGQPLFEITLEETA